MVRSLIEMRGLAAMLVAAAVGVWGLTAFPMSRDNPFLELVALRNPIGVSGAVLQLRRVVVQQPVLRRHARSVRRHDFGLSA